MSEFLFRPSRIARTGDDTPAPSLLGYVWRMSGRHQVWLCLLAGATATLTAVPLELQRRIVDEVVKDRDIGLLWTLAGLYLAVLLVQGLTKYALRLYQGWVSESAIRYNRAHLTRIYESHNGGDGNGATHGGEAVSIIGAEIDRLGGFVGEGLSQPVVNGGMLLAIAGYMLVVEPLVAAISLVFVVPQILLMPLLQRYINHLLARRVTLMRGFGDKLAELPEAEHDFADSDMPGRLDRIYDNRIRTFVLKYGQKAVVNLLNGLAPLSVLLVGGLMVIEGETTLGVVVAFISGFDRLSTPLRELIAYYRVAAQANVQHRMIARWM
jgi:ABC-type bacteriocin/lantibiotic exporter with double-glycine peptidase domain